MSKKERVLVVGAGFGGVKAALELCKDSKIDTVVLSDSDELRYYPTLFHTATGGSRSNSSIPLSRIFEDKPIEFIEGRAKTLDRKAKTVTTDKGDAIAYDTLVIGLGVVTNYFGITGMDEFSYTIKSQDESERFKKHLHDQLLDDHKPDLNYVVVGAGPTGIELAGALPSYIERIAKNHGVKHKAIHVDLIEAAPKLLPRLPKHTSNAVKKHLKKLGVRIYTGSAVQAETIDKIIVNGKPIRSHTVVWTAGVTNHPFFAENQFVIMPRGKVATDIYLQAEPGIFVIGDNANTPYSGMAQTALRDGEFVAKNIRRRLASKSYKSYVAKQPITVIPAGPRWAAVIWGRFKFHGLLGHMVRQSADFVGFHHLEPWPSASKQFMTEFNIEDKCQVCAAATAE